MEPLKTPDLINFPFSRSGNIHVIQIEGCLDHERFIFSSICNAMNTILVTLRTGTQGKPRGQGVTWWLGWGDFFRGWFWCWRLFKFDKKLNSM